MFPCETKEFNTQPTLSIRFRSPVHDLPKHFGRVYGAVMQYLGELGEQPAGMTYAAYYNMDMQDLDIEIGFFFDKALEGRGDVKPVVYPAMAIASAMHKGPYDTLNVTYDALNAWIKEQGDEPTGVVFEFYLNSPQEVPPEEMLTRIEFILK